jgi:RimJ/RimL family protein N-acetyltransferase
LAELKEYKDFNDFIRFNKEFAESNTFLYFNLIRTIKRVQCGEVLLIKFFNVLDGKHLFCCLMIEGECLLYANSVSKDMVGSIVKGLEFEKFKRYQFFGTKNAIDLLFSENNVKYSEQRHRNYYECTQVSEPFDYADGEATMGEMERFLELAEFGQMFKDEFYENEDEKPNSNVEAIIYRGIENRNIFQWVSSGKLVAMAQVIYKEHDNPIIGHVFTHPKFRGEGYASSLIHTITKGLLERGHEKCWLMTNAYNPASNKSFRKVGYNLIGEYVMRYKEE